MRRMVDGGRWTVDGRSVKRKWCMAWLAKVVGSCYNMGRGCVAQLVRAFGSHPKGHRFESYHTHLSGP